MWWRRPVSSPPLRWWRQAAVLARRERSFLVRAWLLLLVIPLAARLLPLPRLLALLEHTPNRRPDKPLDAERLASLVAAAARRHVFTPTCLHRTLALYRLLVIQGERAELVLGTRRAGDRLEAHAWLEHAGRTLGGAAGSPAYDPLLRWGREGVQ